MLFQFNFSKELFQKHNSLQFNRAYGKHIKQNGKNAWFAVAFFVIGAFLSLQSIWIGAVLITAGIFYGYAFMVYRKHYQGIKKNMESVLEKTALEFDKHADPIIWEFLPDRFSYQDFRFKFTVNWNELTATEVTGDTLIMEFKYTTGMQFFLDQDEVGSESFTSILKFLKEVKSIE